jgi:membrane protein DedA with SNARE-associated domain
MAVGPRWECWRRLLAFHALGAGLWVGVWASVGYTAGSHFTAI